jgi:hypothetical protein
MSDEKDTMPKLPPGFDPNPTITLGHRAICDVLASAMPTALLYGKAVVVLTTKTLEDGSSEVTCSIHRELPK